ncbi:hypothetical protein Lacidipiscis_02124 [Ligilactobacillus acidipiscis]|uniref:hypothetical protein n=1 Tax=Ligilactobacillus acidipiscis TaxID=89059 RepID=UPI000A23853F|nr:hypothetical protein Lacidipiscis_02124 [Ligilactobacillus acidipiscis]GEN21743.1 hypothetical protein LAC02_50240 [Ligilactobacillus acidipiscis]
MNTKPGLNSFRKNKTERPENFNPEKSAEEKRVMPNNTILEHPNRRLTTKDLPKSIRLTLDTHSAISTIASIENKKMYEVVTDIVENYVQNLPPQSKKIVRNSIEAIKKSHL